VVLKKGKRITRRNRPLGGGRVDKQEPIERGRVLGSEYAKQKHRPEHLKKFIKAARRRKQGIPATEAQGKKSLKGVRQSPNRWSGYKEKNITLVPS